MTEAQKRVTMRRFEARRKKMNELLQFYMQNNLLYKSLEKNSKEVIKLKRISSLPQSELDNVNVVYHIENKIASEEITKNQSNIRRHTVFDTVQTSDEETMIDQNASLFTTEAATEPITTLKMATAQVIDGQQAGKFLPASSTNFFGSLFPHLFPFGYGHPDTPIKVSVSMQECIKHYLNLSSRRFAQDETFPLVAFDIFSRKRAMSHISLTCRLNPQEIGLMSEISSSHLAAQLDQEARKREALRNGHGFVETTKRKPGKALLRRVQIVLGKSFARNEERKIYQRKSWNMAAKYHGAAMFITVTPNENGNASVAFFSGDITKENLASICENDIPSNASRIEIAGRDPVACDLFFTNMLEILIGSMIGFDMKTKLPRKNGGLFGIPLAFLGGIESQGKGTLHIHLIVFLAGFPKDPDEILYRIRTDREFENRLYSFFDSSISSRTLETEEASRCPICGAKGTIESQKIDKIAYNNILQLEKPPPTSKCNNCVSLFGGDELVRNYTKQMKTELIKNSSGNLIQHHTLEQSYFGVSDFVSKSERQIDNEVAIKAAGPTIPHLPVCKSSDDEFLAHKIFLIDLLLLNQNHRRKHVSSCFKKSSNSKDGCCRYNFPRLVKLLTEMDTFGIITGKRTIGSEYINSFNLIMLQVFRSNHDVRFLLCCAHEIYYTIKYVVKNQNLIDSIAAITIASYTRRLEREKRIKKDISKTQSVYGRIASIAYARSEMVEVGAVTAVHYLLHGTTFVSSHEFQSLHLGRHLNELDEIEDDLGIIPYGKAYIAFNVTSNYTKRPLEVEKESLYDYSESFVLSKDIPKNINSNPNCLRLHPDHPFFATKVVKRRKVNVIAAIIGPRIPHLYNITEEDMEKYSKTSLVLFKPYRTKHDLLQHFKTYTEAFAKFKEMRLYEFSQAKKILFSMQQYYAGKRRAQEMRDEQMRILEQNNEDSDFEKYDECDNTVLLTDEDEVEAQADCSIDDMGNICTYINPNMLRNILEGVVENLNLSKVDSTSEKDRHSCSTEGMRSTVSRPIHKHYIYHCESIRCWPTHPDQLIHKFKSGLTPNDVQNAIKNLRISNDAVQNNHIASRNIYPESPERETIVRLLEDAVRTKLKYENHQQYGDFTEKIASLLNPSLAQVSSRFNLNERKDISFRIAGSYLLDSFKRSLLLLPPGKPLRLHLSGEGGTGKSRVVEALRFLSNGWGKPDAIVTLAPTGIAAVQISGETVHSKLKIFQNKKPTLAQLEEWSKVFMIIWDEISMTGQSLFAKAMKKIKTFLGTQTDCDPRVHIVTAGDFAQLPPCFEKYIFSAPAREETNYAASTAQEMCNSNCNIRTTYSTNQNLKSK